MRDLLPSHFHVLLTIYRTCGLHYLWFFCWNYVARNHQHFLTKIPHGRNCHVCAACHGRRSGRQHRTGNRGACNTKYRKQYPRRHGYWSYFSNSLIDHALYLQQDKKTEIALKNSIKTLKMFLFLKSKRQLKRLQRLLQQNNYNATPNCRQNDLPAVFVYSLISRISPQTI